jgi:crotonobetainyl-CoA:carnitine CoA-transferase CaiB-like acyl-CoA transferase
MQQTSNTASPSLFGSLSDLRILDLTQMLAGPYCTMVLADQGATVVKIEPPEGDMSRGTGLYRDDDQARLLGGYFQSIDRNKDSVVLDLKTEAGKAAFLLMVQNADIVVESFRAGVMDRLGLSYETLLQVNPRLVYGSLRGFGDPRTGASPYRDWPTYDVVAQAMGGIMAITGPDANSPTKIGPGIGDIVPGLFLACGLLAAVHHARRTGQGQMVDVAMIDSIFALCERTVVQNSVGGMVPRPEGNHHAFLCPFGLFSAKDGLVAIAATKDKFFVLLCRAIEATDLLEDERFSSLIARGTHKAALIPLLNERFSRFTKAELIERLGGKIPFGPVMNVAEALADPHFSIRDMIAEIEQPGSSPIRVAAVPIKMTETPGAVRRRSPLLGEHTAQRLAEAGLTPDEIARLLASAENENGADPADGFTS